MKVSPQRVAEGLLPLVEGSRKLLEHLLSELYVQSGSGMEICLLGCDDSVDDFYICVFYTHIKLFRSSRRLRLLRMTIGAQIYNYISIYYAIAFPFSCFSS